MKRIIASSLATGAMVLTGGMSTPVHAQASASGAPAASIAGANVQPTPAQRMFGDISPKLAELTDNVLFGDVWARPGLSPRDRSLITVSALIKNGLTQDELVEAITHLAFYAGWPSAVTAISVAKEVFQKN